MGKEHRLPTLLICLVLGGVLAAAVLGATRAAGPHAGAAAGAPAPSDYVDIRDVPPAPAPAPARPAEAGGGSPGTMAVDCGRNEQRHYNEDNVEVSPGLPAGAHHTHSYVGNLSTDATSTEASLARAATSCAGGDRSAYYWPVLRRLDRPGLRPYERAAGHGNSGEIVPESSVRLEFRGNPVSKVVAMPPFLHALTGDAVARTAGADARVRARWGCSGSPDRTTTSYPRCPEGDLVTRSLVFPSCWNGLDTTSPGHRSHLLFPGGNGVCPANTFPVPELRVSLSYELPAGVPVAVDSFPEQRHSPTTDHAMFVNAMTERQMAAVVDCLNEGRSCRT
ncbi:DUF1996 domain-containing protein [Streptomyces sp. NPDC054987]